MKSRTRGRPPPPEECGVWLDASQLKKKKCQQAVIPCTSSRFNPLSRRRSTDSMLAEFTQTKSPQLYTKQTSMYSFFSPAGNRTKWSCITSINTMTQETTPELEERNAQEAPTVMKPSPIGPSACLKQTSIECEPAEIQESISLCKVSRNAEKPVSSGGNENDWSCVLGKPEGAFSEGSIIGSQEKTLKPPANYWATGYSSKCQNNWSDSSISKGPHKNYNTEDTFPPSQLFTQDSQGNRVICHRFANERFRSAYSATPLQDKTNVTWDAKSPLKGTLQTLLDEDYLHKMFTQDSEGNKVIKH